MIDTSANQRTGGQILIDALRVHGVERAFCVPGESYITALDALHDAPEIDLVVCRHESGAAMMAEAYGKMTGKPGICFVTRGPGATNASAGVHIGSQDSTPMILFIGQAARNMLEREAFQEIDYRRMFGQMAKWVAQIDETARIPEFISRAFHTATAGRAGPVVLALPEDVLRERAFAKDTRTYNRVEAHPGPDDMARLRELLAAAKNPFVIVGGGGWNAKACADIRRFVEANDLPVGAALRCQDYYDNELPNYAGDVGIGINPKLAERVRAADLLIDIGSRLEEMVTSRYTLIDIPEPEQTFVHVYPGAEELGRVYRPDLPINASMPAFAAAAAAMQPVDSSAWAARVADAHTEFLEWSTPGPIPGDLQLGEIFLYLRQHLGDDAFICNGAGNYTTWIHRYHRYRRYRTQLAPRQGSMGYSVPAAISAKRHHPDRTVISFAGDGCFMMTAQELATAMMHEIPVIFIVVNNNQYGTIRMHQERNYPKRVYATKLVNPDFAAYARSFGANGETVHRTEDFAPAFERAEKAKLPSVIELVLDPEAILPTQTLEGIREAALKRLAQE
jgi:acetolactate synthase I/II/III large subunit